MTKGPEEWMRQAEYDLYDFVFMLNRVSIPTRYPDDLQKMIRTYTKEKTKGILENSKELLKWLRTKL